MDSSRWYNLQSDRLHSAFEKQKNRCKKYTHILRGWLWVRLAGVNFHVLETKNQKRLSLWWDLMQIKYHMHRKRCEHGQNRSIKENRRAPWIGKRRNLKAGCYHHCKHGIPCGRAHCIAYFGRKKKLSPGPVHRHTCKIWAKREQRTAIRLHDDQKLSKLWRHWNTFYHQGAVELQLTGGCAPVTLIYKRCN